MTYADPTTARPSFWSILAAPFRAIGWFLVNLAETSSRMDAVRRLNATTDAELAARGTDRAAEVRRIFSSIGAI